MIQPAILLGFLVPAAYLLTALLALRPRSASFSTCFVPYVLALHLAWLVALALRQGSLALHDFAHVLAVGSLLTATGWVAVEVRANSRALAILFGPALAVATGWSSWSLTSTPIRESVDPSMTTWFALHASTGTAALALGWAAVLLAATYLVQHVRLRRRSTGLGFHRLPDLATLDRLLRDCSTLAAVLLLLTGIAGTVWLLDQRIAWMQVAGKSSIVVFATLHFGLAPIARSRGLLGARRGALWIFSGWILLIGVLVAGVHGH